MRDRLRVLVVGVTAEDAERLRARVKDDDVIDIAGVAVLADMQSGATAMHDNVDAVLMTRRALGRSSTTTAIESEPTLVEHLTPRERAVLALVADGLPNREIATVLEISEHTVKFHLASVFGKLGVSSRTEAVRRGLRLGLIEI